MCSRGAKKPLQAVFLTERLFLSDFELLVAFDAARTDLDATPTDSLGKRDPLEIGVLAAHSTRIEFRCADAV